LKRQIPVAEIRKVLGEKAARSGGAYPSGYLGRRDNPLYRQGLAKIGDGGTGHFKTSHEGSNQNELRLFAALGPRV